MSRNNDWLQTELDELTSPLVASPAKTSPSQDPGPACPVSAAACGPSYSELSLKFGRVGQSLRMSLGLELSALTGCSLTWQEQATPLGRSWWVLSMPEPRTDDSGFGLLPTPRTTDTNQGRQAHQKNGNWYRGKDGEWGANLADVALMLPTPKASDGRPKGNGGDRNSPGLDQLARRGMLTTRVKNGNGTGGGRLSAEFVSWMMNYPKGWTEVE